MHSKITQEATRRFGISGGIRLLAATVGIAAVLGACQGAHAATLFATSFGNSNISKVDTTTQAVTIVENTPVAPDSLIFDTNGNIIYTGVLDSQLRLFNPKTNSDTLIASGFQQPRDLTLDPGGKSVLVSDFFGGGSATGTLDRVDLTSGMTTLSAPVAAPNGVTYDKSGRLFVVSGNVVDQLDPTTLGVLNSSPAFAGPLDGLAFDPVTGKLFASDEGGSTIFELDPSNLSSNSVLTTAIPGPDGLESDGKGNLFAASFFGSTSHVFQDVLATNTVTQNAFVPGLDDLAPLVGAGAPPPTSVVPEPCSLSLLMLGGLPLFRRRRRRAAAA